MTSALKVSNVKKNGRNVLKLTKKVLNVFNGLNSDYRNTEDADKKKIAKDLFLKVFLNPETNTLETTITLRRAAEYWKWLKDARLGVEYGFPEGDGGNGGGGGDGGGGNGGGDGGGGDGGGGDGGGGDGGGGDGGGGDGGGGDGGGGDGGGDGGGGDGGGGDA